METSVRIWLNADELWLMTPNSISPRKNSGATTAAGRIWIKNLHGIGVLNFSPMSEEGGLKDSSQGSGYEV